MTDQITTTASDSQPDNELTRFRSWAVECGHYPVTEAVDRYLLMKQVTSAAPDETVGPANG